MATRSGSVDWSSLRQFDPRQIRRFNHRLHEEPLLAPEALRALARRLEPGGHVKYRSPAITAPGDLFVTADKPATGTLDSLFDDLAAKETWLAIYELNHDPAYRGLCQTLLRELDAHIGRDDPGMYGPDLAVFLSAPPAFTPYHIDQHPVFFFQVQGIKHLYLWDPSDPEVLAPELVEDFLCNKTEGKIRFDEKLMARAHEIVLHPGEGVYWPATAPHLTFTREQSGFSLSFNISYYTEATRRRLFGAAFNQLLRNKTPLHPRPFHDEGLRDALKLQLGKRYLQVRRLVTGHPLRPEQGV